MEGDVGPALLAAWALGDLLVFVGAADALRFSRGAFEACRTHKRAWLAAFALGIVVVPLGIAVVVGWAMHRPSVRRAERNRGVGGAGARRI